MHGSLYVLMFGATPVLSTGEIRGIARKNLNKEVEPEGTMDIVLETVHLARPPDRHSNETNLLLRISNQHDMKLDIRVLVWGYHSARYRPWIAIAIAVRLEGLK